ncbi:pilus assembly protein [Uliginosibacterium paludis]|uniref:PilC/PilY family type IV pilus protein n=1 Tax=Uliginosibacterium paludis TaxID=1615952 RepID=A0ABV2CTK4_9RHOO
MIHKARRAANLLRAVLLVAGLSMPVLAGAAVDLADAPLFSSVTVPGNLALTLSVEWPTATTPAYTVAYSSSSTYLGYFDPVKCYTYVYNSTTPSSSYFTPSSYSSSGSHTCSSSSSAQLWSGNFLNWVSMQTLDTFRWVLTGGYRSTDTSSETILTKTFAGYNSSVMPHKSISSAATTLTGATPLKWTAWNSRVRYAGTAVYFTNSGTSATAWTDYTDPASKTATGTDYNGHNSYVTSSNSKYANPATVYRIFINVKVCDSSVKVEDNCVGYPLGSSSPTVYKPEGLLQSYSSKLRYSTFGYLHDDSRTEGGVLRARMKYIGPTQPVPGSSAITNSLAEWSSTTGIMTTNPDSTDATTAQTFAKSAGWTVSITNSGVMNYLNKFGSMGFSSGGNYYKSKDPVGELYYSATRYFRNKGNVASYSTLSGAGSSATAAIWMDGFPVIATWDDPILYTCQKNFILGIGDTYSWYDAELPGSALSSSLSSEVSADAASESAPTTADKVNVQAATNMVGKLEGYSGNLGTQYNGSSRSNTMYIAGLAYDAHTRDIRSDLTGTQTINTYWLDVHENAYYEHKNQYWLAAKYGGFEVPSDFSPYASSYDTSTLKDSTWIASSSYVPFSGTTYATSNGLSYSTDSNTNCSTLTGGVSSKCDKRPSNYFPGNSPDTMKSGLTTAFAKIASEAAAATATALSSPTPQQTSSGNANYEATYDPSNWTGTLKGQTVSYDSSGNPIPTVVWNAHALLTERTYTTRQIVTWCGSTGVAFNTSMNCTASLAAVDGVSSQSAANYIAYLRGDRTQEVANGGVYRTRSSSNLLGDIVNAKVIAVGAPDGNLTDRYNDGYSAFKRTYASRNTVVYVGANDGMMHAFDGSVTSSTGGKELFAYIPGLIYSDTDSTTGGGLSSLGNPSFTHRYLVDGTPNVFDIDFAKAGTPTATSTNWHSVLIAGVGKGGKGYYAIDVTDPSSWTSESAVAGKALWEFTNTHMGYSYGAALVVKTAKYGWVAVLTSGYNNDDGKGYFFFVNPKTGVLLETVVTSEGSTSSPLNMAHASAFVPNYKDGTADAIYAGDLQGNVWRLDLTKNSGSYASPTKFATLKSTDGTAQPVTTRPLIEIEPSSSKRYVLVGTGRLLADSDISSAQVQTFYAIIDGKSDSGAFYGGSTSLPSGVTLPVTRSVLQANTDLTAGIGSNPAKTMGWYYDLSVSSNVAARVTVDPTYNNGIVAFAANLPNGEACSPSGTSQNHALAVGSGQSVLTDSSGNTVAYISQSSVTTELAFVNVNGKIRLLAGSSDGTVVNVPGTFSTSTSLKRMNWRMVPMVD